MRGTELGGQITAQLALLIGWQSHDFMTHHLPKIEHSARFRIRLVTFPGKDHSSITSSACGLRHHHPNHLINAFLQSSSLRPIRDRLQNPTKLSEK